MLTTLLASLPALTGAAFGSLNAHALPGDKTDFTFAVIGDNRPAGAGLPPTASFRRLVGDIATIGPDFVISSGDLVYGNEETLDQYRTECKQVKVVLDGLPCPFFNAPGNHEIAERKEFQSEYERTFGAMQGAFTFGGCRFVAVCTDELGHPNAISPSSGKWLEQELAYAGPKVLFFHHPIFARESNSEGEHTLTDAPSWHAKFVAAHVDQVFEGHDHVFNHQAHDGVEYWISGGGGAPLDTTPDDGGFHHFLLVSREGGKFKVATIPEGALEIVPQGNGVAIANYSDENLTLHNLRIKAAGPGATFKATLDKKGKLSDVPVKRLRYDAATHMATIEVQVAKHRKTTVRPG